MTNLESIRNKLKDQLEFYNQVGTDDSDKFLVRQGVINILSSIDIETKLELIFYDEFVMLPEYEKSVVYYSIFKSNKYMVLEHISPDEKQLIKVRMLYCISLIPNSFTASMIDEGVADKLKDILEITCLEDVSRIDLYSGKVGEVLLFAYWFGVECINFYIGQYYNTNGRLDMNYFVATGVDNFEELDKIISDKDFLDEFEFIYDTIQLGTQ